MWKGPFTGAIFSECDCDFLSHGIGCTGSNGGVQWCDCDACLHATSHMIRLHIHSVRLWCAIPEKNIQITIAPCEQFHRITFKKTQLQSEKITPCERALTVTNFVKRNDCSDSFSEHLNWRQIHPSLCRPRLFHRQWWTDHLNHQPQPWLDS